LKLAELYEELGLKKEEYEEIVRILGRKPNNVELGMFSVMWSEHCSYKSSKNVLSMLPTRAERVLVGPGENAGVLDVGDGFAVVFKMESHNHPSAVEPFQGAATGVGGIVRDIFAMGARPIALLDPLRFGSLSNPRTRYLFEGVVAGIASYGNCLGIPTVGGDLYFEEAYEENPLVNVMCLGIMPRNRLVRGVASIPGSIGVLIGSSTGRDGIGGVSVLASQEFDERSQEKRPSVQVGDPFTEKLEIEACLEMLEEGLLLGLQDLGGAGLTCATCETAERGGCGMDVDISRVPLREPDMEPVEIMMSESQERMFALTTEENLPRVIEVCKKWGLDATAIARVTEGDTLSCFWKGEKVAEVPASSLARGPVYKRESRKPEYIDRLQSFKPDDLPEPDDPCEVLELLLSSANIASRQWVYHQYDHMVRLNTLILPGSDSAVLRIKGTGKALSLSCDGNGRYCYLDPFVGGQIAVAESARNVACSGATPLAITNCLNFGNPEKPEIFWQFKKAVEGLSRGCVELGTPVVGGNVSFYNESFGEAIYPTPIVGMVGLMENFENRLLSSFLGEGLIIVLLGATRNEIGGSEYLKVIHGKVAGKPPVLDWDAERALIRVLVRAANDGIINSAHDLSEGGLGIALAEACVLGGTGAEIELPKEFSPCIELFSESQSRAIVTVKPGMLKTLEDLASENELPIRVLGKTGGKSLDLKGFRPLEIEHLGNLFFGSLERMIAGAHH